MANENAPNTNHSQFFITLGACDWLNKKHTIFGKVTGNTIFNVLRIGDSEVDANERPIDSITIKKIEVLSNPFDDIVPRFLVLLCFFFLSISDVKYRLLLLCFSCISVIEIWRPLELKVEPL